MSEWMEYQLGDLTDWFSGGTPSKENAQYWAGPIPWISAKTMTNYKVNSSGLMISKEGLASGSRMADINDILLLVRGSGLFNDIPINIVSDNVAFNQDIKAIRSKKMELQKFIFFWLHGNKKALYDIMEETGIGAGKFETDLLKKLRICIPENSFERDQIVETAQSIFDKIDLLHRNNKTLEEMAETLFRQWFVEGAKEEWEVMRLDDLSTHVKDSVNPQKSKNAFYHHFSLPAFDNGKRPEFVSAETILSNKYLIKENDILISKLNPRTPRVWLIGSTPECSICSTEFQVYRAEKDNLIEFLYCFLKTQQVTDTLAGAASGTSGSHQRVSPSDISSLELMVPHEELLLKFHSITSPMFGKVRSNLETIKNLEEARNTLLPKLMSGQVRVGNN